MTAIQILLVEDNLGDVRLATEALKESQLLYQLHVVLDGVEALTFLGQEADYSQVPRPDVIILDLNLPKKNGLEVLDEIRSDQNLKDIPILILTSSESDLDVLMSYKKKASGYLVKPSTLGQFNEVINAISVLCQ